MYTIIIHPDEKKGFWVEVPALSGCYTQGETIEECKENAKEAITGYLEVLQEQGKPIPQESLDENSITSKIEVSLPVTQ